MTADRIPEQKMCFTVMRILKWMNGVRKPNKKLVYKRYKNIGFYNRHNSSCNLRCYDNMHVEGWMGRGNRKRGLL